MRFMFSQRSCRRIVAGTFLLLVCGSAAAADAPLFAAPTAGPATGQSAGASLGQVTLALAVVLAFVFVAAWAVRHLRKLNIAGTTQQLQVVSQVALGSKERAVLIRVNEIHVLVGVAPGQVTALHAFTAPVDAPAKSEATDGATTTTQMPIAQTSIDAALPVSFQALLKKSLGIR